MARTRNAVAAIKKILKPKSKATNKSSGCMRIYNSNFVGTLDTVIRSKSEVSGVWICAKPIFPRQPALLLVPIEAMSAKCNGLLRTGKLAAVNVVCQHTRKDQMGRWVVGSAMISGEHRYAMKSKPSRKTFSQKKKYLEQLRDMHFLHTRSGCVFLVRWLSNSSEII